MLVVLRIVFVVVRTAMLRHLVHIVNYTLTYDRILGLILLLAISNFPVSKKNDMYCGYHSMKLNLFFRVLGALSLCSHSNMGV